MQAIVDADICPQRGVLGLPDLRTGDGPAVDTVIRIGKKGQNAHALRHLLNAVSAKEKKRAVFELLE